MRMLPGFGVVAALAALAVPSAAAAQTSVPVVWEIEGYGGFTLGQIRSAGTAALPEAGPPITTSSPIFPSRQVPSWFFGDGSALLNDVLGEFGLPSRVTPLDPALGAGLRDARGVLFGARLRRHFGPRYAGDVGLEISPTSAHLTDALLAAAEASRATFADAMGALLATGPFVNPVVTATRSGGNGSGRDILLTAAATMFYARAAGFEPYATAGGGIVFHASAPAITLEGHYRFSVNGSVPIDETDRTVIKVDSTSTFVGVFGGGVRRDLSDRWGFDVDGRVFISRAARLVIDTTPSAATGTPAGFVESLTYPNLQFSNNSSTGRVSTLSGRGLHGFEALSGGMQATFRLTIGVFAKF